MELILDIKSYICKFDEEVWIKMVIYDEEFKLYSHSKDGINQFIKLFYRENNGERLLFGKLHSVNDLPAIIHANGTKYWYCNDKIHRENDLPAIIYANDNKHWYCNGEIHRENDLPASIHSNGDKYWYCKGKLHRENDLHAIIHANGNKFWYCNGIFQRN
jgi:antitoxin component YwqK of YwqJK toxin-antitoxin module